MIVSRPSISTMGPACDSIRRKYGRRSASLAASSCSLRSWVRARSKTSTGARMVSGMRKVSHGGGRRDIVGPSDRIASGPMRVTVRPVDGKRDLKEFIRVPFRLHRDSPWVPPLIMERKQFLDRDKNPFFEHAEAEYFLAERDGEPVGRITAHVDERWTQFQGGNDGMFGFFESENDPETARALVDAATGWLRARGRERMLGPMDFTTNDECGILIEGYDLRPMVLEPWHPPYYRELLEGLGMTKSMDLLMWELHLGKLKQGDRFHDFIEEAARKSETEHGVTVRQMRKSDLEAEVGRFMEVYNEAWGPNWGFVPITEEEVAFQAKNLKPILDENWAMIAEREGEVVGAALTLPDINQVLRRMNGRLFPLGWWRF